MSSPSEYADVLASLYALEAAKGMDFKLDRVTMALRNLGDPQRRFASVHIAGTNGKGSVAAMLHAIFLAAGHRVGLYTSPHLVSFTERIRVGADEVSADEVVELARHVHSAATVRGIDLTFFEFVTVMAFLHFARLEVPLAMIETGLGGRLDATNVVDPEVAVITSIGLDHQEFLGDTLESVAREKAGIIKPGRPVIVGLMLDEAMQVIEQAAAERRSPLLRAGRDFMLSNGHSGRFHSAAVELNDLVIGLAGRHQRDNAAVALAVALMSRERFAISEEALRLGLAQVRWPGRLETVARQPLVLLDGAHNIDGAATLCDELPGIVGSRPVHLVFAVMRDKVWQPMVESLAPLAASATLTAALPRRAEDPQRLLGSFERYCPTQIVGEPIAALEAACRRAGADGAVVVTGSLFLIGAVYPYFLRQRGAAGLFQAGTAALHL